MPPGEAFAVVGVVFLAIGLVATWVRNGKSQATRDGIMEERIKGINTKLEDPNTGLGAIKESVGKIEVHCGKTTSSFKERLKNLEDN